MNKSKNGKMKSTTSKIKSLWCFMKTSIKIFIRTRSFREVINRQFSDENKIVVELGEIDYIVTKNKNKFYMSRLINTATQAQKDYIFDDINKSDIVIDIGAGIGGFSIPASKKAKYVYAVEPLTSGILRENIFLNNRKNIDVLDMALGDGKTQRIEWSGKHRIVKTKTLSEIKNICGGCDFLKVDCEGYEWTMESEELRGIRAIEMEVHKIGFPLSIMEERLKKAGFSYRIENQPEGSIGLWIIHARKEDKT